MFQTLVNFLAGIFNAIFQQDNSATSWLVPVMQAIANPLGKFFNGWIWLISAIAIVVGMFSDAAQWIYDALSSISISGISISSSASFFANSASLSNGYGFVDAFFPFHELLAALAFLMPLFLLVNFIRLTRAVLSAVQIAGFGINN